MAKILIAEDDEFLRDILQEYLTSKGNNVTTVPNGKVARDVVLNGGFELIISDIQMPFLNGVEFLQWLRPQSQTPFILMTGFTNLLETQKAADLGAQGFLSKPFSNKDLLKLINEVLQPLNGPTTSEETEKIDADFCKVPIEEFVAQPKIEFDIYVKLQSARYLKIAHQGEILDVARLNHYKEKGVCHLHIKVSDFDKLVKFNMQVSQLIQSSDKISREKKVRFARYSAEVLLERCYVADMNKEAFGEAQNFVQKSLGVITENQNMMDLLGLLNDHSDHLYAHCLAVSAYSVMIAKNMNYVSSQVAFKLAMAGLFHDIGKKEISREVLYKPRPLLSAAERAKIESHVSRGREILEAIPGIPDDVLRIVYEHHEDEVGHGYPNGSSKLKLHPLSLIVQVADQFVTRALKSPNSAGLPAGAAVAQMEKFEAERLNKMAFVSLKNLVQTKKAA